jgi:hypothetical protein
MSEQKNSISRATGMMETGEDLNEQDRCPSPALGLLIYSLLQVYMVAEPRAL